MKLLATLTSIRDMYLVENEPLLVTRPEYYRETNEHGVSVGGVYLDTIAERRERGAWIMQDVPTDLIDFTDQVECVVQGLSQVTVDEVILPHGNIYYPRALGGQRIALSTLQEAGFHGKIAAVVHGCSFQECVDHYTELSCVSEIDTICIPTGIPYEMPEIAAWHKHETHLYEWVHLVSARRAFIDYLLERQLINMSKQHHLYGYLDPSELGAYHSPKYSFIRSAHDALPYIHSLYGALISPQFGLYYRKIELPEYMHLHMRSAEHVRLFKSNLQSVKHLAGMIAA